MARGRRTVRDGLRIDRRERSGGPPDRLARAECCRRRQLAARLGKRSPRLHSLAARLGAAAADQVDRRTDLRHLARMWR